MLSNINFRQGFLLDVIVLVYTGEDASDDDLAEAEDVNNSGSHINDQYNVRDENGNVLVNVGHPTADPDIYLSPLVAKCIKPHQVCSCLCTLILSCWMLIQGSPFKNFFMKFIIEICTILYSFTTFRHIGLFASDFPV